MRKNLYLIMIGVVSMFLTGCGADQALKKGDKFYAMGEYFDAANQYKKAYSQTPAKERQQRGQRALKMAECYRRINYTQKAIAAYNNAIRYKQTDSMTYLYLAQQLMKNAQYKEAEKQFQTALDSMGNNASMELRTLATTGLHSAQKAPRWKKEGSDYTIKEDHDNYSDSVYKDCTRILLREHAISEVTEIPGLPPEKKKDLVQLLRYRTTARLRQIEKYLHLPPGSSLNHPGQ